MLTDVSDASIHGIIVKASLGFCELLQSLNKTLPDLIILPISLTVTTTKRADIAKKVMNKTNNKFLIHNDIITQYSTLNNNEIFKNHEIFINIYEGFSGLSVKKYGN